MTKNAEREEKRAQEFRTDAYKAAYQATNLRKKMRQIEAAIAEIQTHEQ